MGVTSLLVYINRTQTKSINKVCNKQTNKQCPKESTLTDFPGKLIPIQQTKLLANAQNLHWHQK